MSLVDKIQELVYNTKDENLVNGAIGISIAFSIDIINRGSENIEPTHIVAFEDTIPLIDKAVGHINELAPIDISAVMQIARTTMRGRLISAKMPVIRNYDKVHVDVAMFGIVGYNTVSADDETINSDLYEAIVADRNTFNEIFNATRSALGRG